jgi:ADP-ribosyl-[dinitrogen reductase] hydrolase
MTNDQAAGLWWGLFIGDAMGVPLEFTKPCKGELVTTFTSGGYHNASEGEYSDDGSMALAIADAYISKGKFCGSTIQQNFLDWMNTAWDIGMTVLGALNRVKETRYPYTGSADDRSSGNGCIMRLAPCIIWNRNNLSAAIGESVAQALLTHGSSDCITYTSALAHELWEGRPLPQYDHLRDRAIKNSGYIADTYASAWYSVKRTSCFKDAVVDAINRGGDADTVGAVTGMIAGRLYGEKPASLCKQLFNMQTLELTYRGLIDNLDYHK